ncbi:Uncharacterized protein FKW44_021962, partial [Caligus rogercresseyi]
HFLRIQNEKERLEAEMFKESEKMDVIQGQAQKAQKDRENLQTEMEILLDRINKLSDILDKARV